jgi:DNA-binding Xre family transcriptional regulator
MNDITARVGPNLLLRSQMASRGFSKNRLAQATQTDERTIQRWLDGQAHLQADNARRIADALACEPGDLWPDRFSAKALDFTGTLPVTLFASRAHIPVSLWHEMFTQANNAIDICVYGGTFLFDTIAAFSKMMVDAAARGVQIRFIAGDPNSESVKRRGEDERVGSSLPSRCALTLDRLKHRHHLGSDGRGGCAQHPPFNAVTNCALS